MTDTWIQASFAFTCSNAEMALLEEAFLAAPSLADDDEPDPPSAKFLAVFPPTGDDVWSGLRAIFTGPNFPSLRRGRLLANGLISRSRYLQLAGASLLKSPASVLAIRCCLQTGVVLPLPSSGSSKLVTGRRVCEAGFQNSFDKQQAAEMRCGHGPPARSPERKVFA